MHDGHPWQVRIPDPEDPAETLGSGVLIGARHVMTCAGVAAAALGVTAGTSPPAGEVPLELPLVPEPLHRRGAVVAWAPGAGLDPRWTPAGTAPPGLAVLELTEPVPAAIRPAQLEPLDPADYRERAVFCLGFPPDAPTGRRVHADCADAQADSITGLKTDHGVLDRSFTGTGAWDPIQGSLLGLVVAEEFPGPTGLLIPAEVLRAVWPETPVRSDHGARARLLRWVAGLDTRRGNLLLRLLAGLAFLGLAVVWWLEPDTGPAPVQTVPTATRSRLAGFVWEVTGQPIPGARVMVPSRTAAGLTDRFGRFDLGFQEPSGTPVELIVLAPGYQALTEAARLGDTRLDLVLRRAPAAAQPEADAGAGIAIPGGRTGL